MLKVTGLNSANSIPSSNLVCIKGGYLDFSHLTKLKNLYITEFHTKKQYKSSIIKNHKIEKKKIKIVDGVP